MSWPDKEGAEGKKWKEKHAGDAQYEIPGRSPDEPGHGPGLHWEEAPEGYSFSLDLCGYMLAAVV